MVNGSLLAFYLILYSWYGPFIQLIISRIRLSQKRLSLSRATTALPSLWQCKVTKEKGALQIFRPKTAIFEGYFSLNFYEKSEGGPFKYESCTMNSSRSSRVGLSDTKTNWTTGQLDMDILVFLNVQTYMSI